MYERAPLIGAIIALIGGYFVIYSIVADSRDAAIVGSLMSSFVIGWSARGVIDSHWIRRQVAELRDIINNP